MKTIFRYRLKNHVPADLVMPAGAEILHVNFQGGELCLWALVDNRQFETERRRFVVVGTGHEFDGSSLRYLDTVHSPSIGSVLHVFEVKR